MWRRCIINQKPSDTVRSSETLIILIYLSSLRKYFTFSISVTMCFLVSCNIQDETVHRHLCQLKAIIHQQELSQRCMLSQYRILLYFMKWEQALRKGLIDALCSSGVFLIIYTNFMTTTETTGNHSFCGSTSAQTFLWSCISTKQT